MNKYFIFLASLLLLSACQSTPKKESVSEESSVSSISESEEESGASEVNESEEESYESVSDEQEEKSEVVESSESEEEHYDFSLLPSHFPNQVAGGYPDDQDISVDGNIFFIHEARLNDGKYDVKTIQMKKETSYFETKTAIKGDLTITFMKNGSYTGSFTVYASTTKGDYSKALTPEIDDKDNTKIVYKYLTGNNTYFKIANESSYAIYATEFNWAR